MNRKSILLLCLVLFILVSCGNNNHGENQPENDGIIISPTSIILSTQGVKEQDDMIESPPVSTDDNYVYEFTELYPRIEEPEALHANSLSQAVIYRGLHADYYFDRQLPDGQRDWYVKSTEQILNVLSEHFTIKEPLQIYAVDTMYYYNGETKKCCLGPEYAGTSVQAALLLQSVLDAPTANYGLLQAAGFCIAEQLGWECCSIPAIMSANNTDIAHPYQGTAYVLTDISPDTAMTVPEDLWLLDLEYPCYSPNYVNEEQLQRVWNMTKHLAGYISEKELLGDVLSLLKLNRNLCEFETQFTQLKNKWLADCSSGIRVTEKQYPIQYGSYGRYAPLQIKTESADWYLHADFDSSLTEDGMYSGLLREDYEQTSTILQELEQEMEAVRTALADKQYDYPRLTYILQELTNNANHSRSGTFVINDGGTIYLESLFALIHEYCHYLLLQEGLFVHDGNELQEYEGQLHLLAYYYGYQSKITRQIIEYIANYELSQGNEGASESIALMEKVYGQGVTNDVLWIVKFYDTCCYDIDYYVIKEDSVDSQVSFSYYLAATYGEDFLYKVSTGNDRLPELVGKTWSELIEEWKTYIKSVYAFNIVRSR